VNAMLSKSTTSVLESVSSIKDMTKDYCSRTRTRTRTRTKAFSSKDKDKDCIAKDKDCILVLKDKD